MKIGLFCLRFPPARGGVETVAAGQAAALARHHEVEVHTSDLLQHKQPRRVVGVPLRESVDGYTVVRHPALTITGPGFSYPILPGLFRSGPFDLILAHSFWYFPAVAGAWMARRQRIPFVLQTHFDPKRGRFNHWYRETVGRRLLRAAALTIFVSHFESGLASSLGLPVENSLIIPNGVDPEPSPAEDPAVRAELASFQPYLAFLGRLDRGKGVDVLLRALARLREPAAARNAVIIGDDFGAREPLLRLAGELGLAERVRFRSGLSRPALQTWLRHAESFVLPSRYEAFGVVINEARALAIPVIAADNSAMPELVHDGRDGLLFRTDDPVHLAEQIRRLAAPGERERLVRAGTALLRERYTVAVSGARLETALRELAARAR